MQRSVGLFQSFDPVFQFRNSFPQFNKLAFQLLFYCNNFFAGKAADLLVEQLLNVCHDFYTFCWFYLGCGINILILLYTVKMIFQA